MNKTFYIITPDATMDENSELIKNLTRLIQAAGDYNVQAEPPGATSLLHIALGILSGTEASVDPAVSDILPDEPEVTPNEAEPADAPTETPDGMVDPVTTDVVEPSTENEEDTPKDEFTFEGFVDGEKVDVNFNYGVEKSFLEVPKIHKDGSQFAYAVNESVFKDHMKSDNGMMSMNSVHRISVNNHTCYIPLDLKESKEGITRLVIGLDHPHLVNPKK